MKVFFDTEFTGLHQATTLVSIGCVADDGRTFYAECTDYDRAQVDDWLTDNVLKHLNLRLPTEHPEYGPAEAWTSFQSPEKIEAIGPRAFVASCLKDWLSVLGPVEMWGDCLAYDWVLFCQLFDGGAECLPRNIYYIPFDLCTLFKLKNIDPDVSREEYAHMTGGQKHNALWDAQVIKACYEKLME